MTPTALDLLDALPAGRKLCADDRNAIRAMIAARSATAVIAPMPQRDPAIPHARHRDKFRNCVARFFNKIKNYRAIATRYDKRDDNLLASVQLASIRLWLRRNEAVV